MGGGGGGGGVLGWVCGREGYGYCVCVCGVWCVSYGVRVVFSILTALSRISGMAGVWYFKYLMFRFLVLCPAIYINLAPTCYGYHTFTKRGWHDTPSRGTVMI